MTWRHYDKVTLDEQYRGEQIYRKRDEVAVEARRLSDQVRGTVPHRAEISYGAHALARFDLFPSPAPNAPVLLFFHGGYWRRNDKADFSLLAPAFLDQGISVAVMNYPLAPAATMDVIVQHARASIAHVAAHAAELGVDPRRIYVSGHSAGGHLTAMAMQTDWTEYGLDFDPVRGACAISGLYDLLPLRLCNLNDIILMDTETAYRNSPLHFTSRIDPATWRDRRIILSVGGDEPYEYHEQQRDFGRALHDAGLASQVVPNEADTHAEVVLSLSRRSALYDAIIAMIARDDPT